MGFFRNIVNGMYKFAFGIDLNKQQKYIDTLEKRVSKLKNENVKLKQKVKTQEQLLHICNENLQRILKPMNKLITFKLYFGVESKVSSKGSSTTTNFEFTYNGIVPLYYDVDVIAESLDSEKNVRMLLDLFKITWLDYNGITTINKGGYDDRMIEDEPTDKFTVGLAIDNSDILYPAQKVDNDFMR